MNDSHGLQSGAGNDRSFHEICRGSPLHDSISGRNVRSLDKRVKSEALLPHHNPIGQWQSIRGRSNEGVNEEIAGGTGPLDHLSPTNEWPS